MQITEWVIDCDTHITEPGDVWTARLPAKYADQAPHIVRDDNGYDNWAIGGSKPFIPVGHTAVAGWPEPFPAAPRNMDEVPEAAYDAKARLAYMDSVGIWSMALYPNVGGFGNEAFLELGDPELMLACVRAYNDWLVEWCSADARRFIPVMATPFWDVEAAVDEVRRGAELGHKAVLFTGEPQRMGQPLLGDPYWEPFWSAIEEVGLPVSLHIGSADFTADFSWDRIQTHGVGATNTKTAITLFMKNGIQVADFLLSGVLARHPELQIVSVESGVGWVPFLLEAADYAFEYSDVRRERPEFDMLPSEYFRRQVYGCWFFEQLALQRMLDVIGEDRLLFETDYPHPVCLYGDVRERIDAALGDLSPETQHRLLWTNAADLYGVPEPDVPSPFSM